MSFLDPDWDAPLDVDDHIAHIPEGETIKGMFVSGVVELAAASGHPLPGARERYVPFRDYPLREQVRLLAEAARVLMPDRSLRRGLRTLGRGAAVVMKDRPWGVSSSRRRPIRSGWWRPSLARTRSSTPARR